MTDYGQFFRDDDDREERRKQREREERERERKRVDKEFEEIVIKPKVSCSANSDLVKYTKHLKSVRTALKAAAADGFCLDEIMDGLKELGDE